MKVRREKDKCISTLGRLKSFLRLLIRVVWVFKILIIFNFRIVRRENNRTKWYQDITQMLQRQHKELSRL